MNRLKASTSILAIACLLAASAYAQVSTEQCSVQSSYPNPVDADGNAVGALLKVSFKSRIGVVLDEIPLEMRDRVADWLRAQPYEFWRTRITKQIDLARYRLQYRNYYVAGQGALPLNDSSLWSITLLGAPKRAPYTSGKKKSVLDAVSVDYRMETVLLTDINSPSASTGHRLDNPGDTVQMDFGLPLDPTLPFQRTGLACYDEYGYPPKSVDPGGEAWPFYDDTCTAQNAQPLNSSAFACNYCHCGFPRPELDCVDALALKMGLVQAPFVFTRMPWSKAVADSYRFTGDGEQVLAPPVENGADLVGWSKDLKNQREIYRYFPPSSCEATEACIGAAGGWRKLIMFYSTDVNNGTLDLHIGAVPYVTGNQLPAPIVNNGDYVFDQCHGHYHFEHYGTFGYVDDQGRDAAGDQQKRGFCLIDLARVVNAEWSPLTIKYFDCKYQGITAGWADIYNIGIPCQWKDVTDTPAGTYNVTASVNPDEILCEGALQCDTNGDQIWDDTQFLTCSEGYTPEVCEVAQAARCEKPTDALGRLIDTTGNNTDVVPSLHRDCGLSYVTDTVSPIGAGQEIGPLRDTEFSFYGNPKRSTDQLRGCKTGARAALKCTVRAGSVPQVVRVCESSRSLGCGTACRYHEALANVTIRPGDTVDVGFTCPAARDGAVFGESGGAYSIYRAMAFGIDGAKSDPDVTCIAK